METTYSDISYDNRPGATQTTGTIGYQLTGSNLQYDIHVGYSNFDGKDDDSVSGGVYRGSLTWQASGSSSLILAANRSIQDQSSGYYDGYDFDDPLADNSDSNAVYTLTDGSLTWQQALGQRTNISLGIYASDEDYEIDIDDNTRYGARASLSRDLTRSVSLRAELDYSLREYNLGNDDQNEYRASLQVEHTLGRRLTFSWGGSYEDRDADTSQSYKEARFNVNLSYQILGNL